MKAAGKKIASVAIALIAWEAVSRSGLVPHAYFPSVIAILRALVSMVRGGKLLHAEVATMARAVGGLLLTVILGIIMGVLAARFNLVARAIAPIVEIMRSIPPAALVPLAIFALGLTPLLFLGIVVFAGFSTVYLTSLQGLLDAEPVQIYVARSLGCGRLETLLRVRLQSAWPVIFTGIRVAVGSALIATIASEMLAGKDGLGFLLYETAFSLRTKEMFAVMLTVALDGLLLNQVIVLIRLQVAGWQAQLNQLGEAG